MLESIEGINKGTKLLVRDDLRGVERFPVEFAPGKKCVFSPSGRQVELRGQVVEVYTTLEKTVVVLEPGTSRICPYHWTPGMFERILEPTSTLTDLLRSEDV